MQSVNDRWYIVYSRLGTILAGLLVLLCVSVRVVPAFKPLGTHWGLSYITLDLALAQIAYYVFIYKAEARQNSYWSATLLLAMLLLLNIFNLIHSTGRLHSWYLIGWGVMVLLSGMFGKYVAVGYCFLITSYFILITADTTGRKALDPFSILAILGTYILAVISFTIWRRYYVDNESTQLAKLSGALKSKEQQTEILLQSIIDGLVVINTDGKVSILNSAAAAMTEWPINEASGIDVQLVMKLSAENGDEIMPGNNPFVRILTEKKPISDTYKLTGRNGKQQIVSLTISPVLLPKSQDLAGAVAVVRDISSTRAEEKRSADFISTASHEMRTPVAAVEGYLALALNDKVSKVDNTARGYLEKAHVSTQSLGKLFQDLLTSARAEDGRLVSHPVVLEMGAFLEQITDSLRFAAEKKGLMTEFIVGTSAQDEAKGKLIKPLYYVLADPDRLSEVITNLFDNAVKYTSSGKISIGLTGNSGVVQLYIRDTGPGIASEDIPHLFQKFYRVDSSATRTVGGTGLGLFICRKIVELYNGRIWVESQINQGSTFYINLPRVDALKASSLQAATASNQAASPLPSIPPAGTPL